MLSWQDEVTALGTAHCHHGSAHLGVIYILPYDTLPRDQPGSSSSCRASEEQGEGTDLAEEGGQEPPARSGPGSPPHPPDSHPPRPLSQFHHPLSVFHVTAPGFRDHGPPEEWTEASRQVQGLCLPKYLGTEGQDIPTLGQEVSQPIWESQPSGSALSISDAARLALHVTSCIQDSISQGSPRPPTHPHSCRRHCSVRSWVAETSYR